ncbi:MAG: hypothetical protein CFK52_03650 [Chloracidobacterium sp. CP2_5A]|nr:MAG: hypothetical protein CFK52_03650 [Chloracidobacterium sp. CP2_5A]
MALHPRTLVAGAILAGVTLGLFAYTVHLRRPWFGQLSYEHHQWLTANTLRFARNWRAEGPWTLRFALLNEPRSVEFPTLTSRNPYVSYPPGFVLTAYAYGALREGELTARGLMEWNLVNQALIALTLGATTLLVLRRLGLGRAAATLLGTIPPSLALLLPGPLYWHQNVYFADQAVLLPFVLFVFLEALRDAFPAARSACDRWLALTSAWGVACDWLFVCLLAVAYAKRLANGDIPLPWSSPKGWLLRSARLGLGGLVALALFFAQLYALGMLPRLKERFLERIGATPVNAELTGRFSEIFWGEYVPAQFGAGGPFLAFFALAGCLALGGWLWGQALRRRESQPGVPLAVWTMTLLTAPCFLQVYALRNHSAIHDFSALKFALPIATTPFALLPATALASVAPSWPGHRVWRAAVPAALLVAALVYVAPLHAGFRALFPEPSPVIEPLGRFVRDAVTEADIVFSPDFEIPTDPPHLLAISGKRVYYAPSVAAIAADVARYAGRDYNVVVLFLRPLDAAWERDLAGTRGVSASGALLYRFDARSFAALAQRAARRPDEPAMPALSGAYRWDTEGVFRLFPRASAP